MRARLRLGLQILVPAVLVAVAVGPASAQEPFFQGKTIRIIISVGVAGGYGEYARSIAEHMPRHIPGEPHMIVQSMPGAGGLLATNYMYAQAPQDGTTIAIVNATVPLTPLWGRKGARFDPTKFNWLGALDRADGVCTFWHTAGINTWNDLLRKEPTVGSIGAGSPMEVYALMLNRLFGTRIRVVGGYKAGSDIDLAMVRGEIDGRCGTHLTTISSLHRDWLVGPKFTVPVMIAEARRKDYPDTPSIMEFVHDTPTRQTLELLRVSQKLDRPVLLPPNVPAGRMQELREAFDATMNDAAFLDEIKRKNLEIDATPGAAMAKLYSDAYASPPDVVAAVKEIMGAN